PPRIARALLRVRLPAIAVGAALVAVDAPRRVAAVSGVLLPRLALPRDVAALAGYFNFSERQCAIFAGQLDAHEAAQSRLAAWHRGGQLLRQTVEQFRDFRVERSALTGIADQRHRVDKVLQGRHRLRAELPRLLDAAIRRNQGDIAQLPRYRSFRA